MATKYKKFVICEYCNGLGKVEEEYTKEDEPEVKKEAAVESDVSTAIENPKDVSTEVKEDATPR